MYMTQRKYELSVFITSKTNKISNFLLFCTLKKIDYSSNNFILSITFNLLLARFWLFCVSHLCWTACFSYCLKILSICIFSCMYHCFHIQFLFFHVIQPSKCYYFLCRKIFILFWKVIEVHYRIHFIQS